MKHWKSIVLLALVFLAGAAVGVVGTRSAVRRAVKQAIAQPENVQSLLERNLTRKLRLDPDQEAKLHGVLTEARGRLRDLRQAWQPQAAVVFRGADTKILALLTPAQQTRYEQLKAAERPLLQAWRTEP